MKKTFPTNKVIVDVHDVNNKTMLGLKKKRINQCISRGAQLKAW